MIWKGDYDMSGRKSTEVNGMLARGKNAREAGMGNFLTNLIESKKKLSKNQKEINEISNRIDLFHINVSSESKAEFPNESREIQEKYDDIKRKNIKVDYSADLDEVDREKQRLDNELKNADKKQDSIRERIRNKNWYCDEEYNEASSLVQKYKKISEKRNSLAAKLKRKVQNSDQDVVKYKSLEKQMNQVSEAEKKLNENSIRIVELREKAVDSKKYVKNLFKQIDDRRANKFCAKEYSELAAQVDDFCNMEDSQVLKKVTSISEDISRFTDKVDLRYSEYIERCERIENGIKMNEDSLSTQNNFYFEPIDYFKNKDNAKKIALIDYLSEYSDKHEMVKKIEDCMTKSKELLESEKFDEADRIIYECSELITKANEYAALLQEHMIENFYVAKDMTNVMKKLGFSTGAYKIDGHIKNGWKISASNPNGENIDFTKVFMDDSGKMNIEIDHKTMGDCPSKWADIAEEMEEVGVYIEGIWMSDGAVVLDKRSEKKTEIIEEKENSKLQERK